MEQPSCDGSVPASMNRIVSRIIGYLPSWILHSNDKDRHRTSNAGELSTPSRRLWKCKVGVQQHLAGLAKNP